jgi:hypothetical protein
MEWVTWTPTLRFADTGHSFSLVIHIGNEVQGGHIARFEDGQWRWWPEGTSGCFSWYELIEIGAELERRNRESALKSVLTGGSHE